jgi:F420-non-reducing hydrogenase iron-sulfur subunit
MEEYKPKLVCFSCKFGWGYLSGSDALQAESKRLVPVICSGKVDTTYILSAFKEGADGVLILACPEGNCHFQDGNFRTEKRIFLLHKTLEPFGIEPERLQIKLASDAEGKSIPRLINEMKSSLQKMGPMRRL